MFALRNRRGLHAAIIVLLTALAYAGSLRGGFISDDVQGVVQNPLLRSLAPANLRAISTSFEAGINYIPLNTLSLTLDYQLWGLAPAGYHATNLVLHVVNAVLIYLLLLRLGQPAATACTVALLWAVHPVQVESVAWISERKNLLSTFFFLLAFSTYLRFSERPRTRSYLLLLGLFVCALVSKINTIALPAVMVAYEMGERFRLRARDLAATVPLLVAGAVVAWVNLVGNRSHGAAYHGGSLWVTLRTSATVVPRYLGLVLDPTRASYYHAVPLRASWLEPAVLGGALTVLGLAATALALIARRRRGAFWIAWFAATLSPMLNIVPFPALMADRYLYIPLLGPLVLLAWGADALAARLSLLARALPVLTAGAVLTLAGLTAARVSVFRDEFNLWADWAVHTPYISADRPYGPKPRPRELELLRATLTRNSDSPALHNNLGAIAFEEGRLGDALTELTQARRLDPQDPAIALNLGRAYLLAGQPAAAARTLEDAVRLEPPSYFALLNLGRACLQLRDAPCARQALEQAGRIHPEWQDWRRERAVLERLERGEI